MAPTLRESRLVEFQCRYRTQEEKLKKQTTNKKE